MYTKSFHIPQPVIVSKVLPNRGSKKISTVSTTTVISEISNYTSSSNANWGRITLLVTFAWGGLHQR